MNSSYSITLKLGGVNVDVVEIISNPAVLSGLTIFGRNLYGWIINSFKDGKIQDYEWKQLGTTIVKLGGLALFLFLGISVVVPGISIEQSAMLAALIDVLKSELKKK